jgi:FkbM family methyltransferase
MRIENEILDIKIDCLNYYPNKVYLNDIFSEILAGIYEMDVKDSKVLDIGAFYGETAVYYSKLGASEIFAYEPFKSESFILSNAQLNGCNNIKSYRMAVSDQDGFLNCDAEFENRAETKVYYAENINKRLNKISLETIVNEHQIKDGCLKVDTEGSEFEIIAGAPIEILRKFKEIIIEVHNYFGNINEITDKLMNSGFDIVTSQNPIIKFEFKDSITMLKCKRNNRLSLD